MATAAEVEDFATHHKGLLYHIARNNLSADCQRHADDVVAETLLSLWEHRHSIRNLHRYAHAAALNLSIHWRHVKSELRKNVHLLSLDAVDWQSGISAVPDIADPQPDPEEALLGKEEHLERMARRERIVALLSEPEQKNYRDWEARNFRAKTHGECCKSTRLRKRICELSGVPYKGHLERIHLDHVKGINAKLTPEQVLAIRAAYQPRKRGMRAELAKQYGISKSHLSRVAHS